MIKSNCNGGGELYTQTSKIIEDIMERLKYSNTLENVMISMIKYQYSYLGDEVLQALHDQANLDAEGHHSSFQGHLPAGDFPCSRDLPRHSEQRYSHLCHILWCVSILLAHLASLLYTHHCLLIVYHAPPRVAYCALL